jgi:hypothetical protein
LKQCSFAKWKQATRDKNQHCGMHCEQVKPARDDEIEENAKDTSGVKVAM